MNKPGWLYTLTYNCTNDCVFQIFISGHCVFEEMFSTIPEGRDLIYTLSIVEEEVPFCINTDHTYKDEERNSPLQYWNECSQKHWNGRKLQKRIQPTKCNKKMEGQMMCMKIVALYMVDLEKRSQPATQQGFSHLNIQVLRLIMDTFHHTNQIVNDS